MDFKVFNEDLGVAGYQMLIHKIMFPTPSRKPLYDYMALAMFNLFKIVPNFSLKMSAFHADSKSFPKKSVFSRVRVIKHDDALQFTNGAIKISDFYPPNPEEVRLSPGRYNDEKSTVMYLSGSPETAEIECKVQDGDIFLRSQYTFSQAMTFFSLDERSALTKPFLDLINNDDIRFYPVITYLMNDIMRFDGYHGCTYDSVPANKIKDFKYSKINIAVWDDFIDKVDFEYSFLCSMRGKEICYHTLFYKKNGKILSLDCKKDIDEVRKKHQDIYDRLIREAGSVKSIPQKYLDRIASPFKTVKEL